MGQTTPVRLRAALVVSWLLTGALGVIVLMGWAQHRRAVKAVGIDAAPSVVAAHKIKIYIETLDANLANELLSNPGASVDFVNDFDKNRIAIGRQIVAASKNITYGEAEQVPIEKIQDSLGRYLMVAQAARDAHGRSEGVLALGEYRKSCKILKEELVPAASDLDVANDSVLEATYQAQKRESRWTLAFTLIVTVALLLLLVVTQIYLSRRFRRRLNLSLALATASCILFVCYVASRFIAHTHDMKGVKEDSYDSVAALIGARADAYEANAAESRWLLDAEMRAEHERTFVN